MAVRIALSNTKIVKKAYVNLVGWKSLGRVAPSGLKQKDVLPW